MEKQYSITPFVKVQTSGIIWITENSLNYETKGVYEINYLLNGLLIQSLASGLSHPEKNLYLSENFGAPFFVIHHSGQSLDGLYNNLSLVETNLSQKTEILFVAERRSENIIKAYEKLAKKYSDYILEPIYLND